MRIACLISTLGPGGAERVAVTLCNRWADAGHGIDLITYEQPEASPHYTLRPGIRLHRLGVLGDSRGAVRRTSALRRRIAAIRSALRGIRPDILLCFMTETNIHGLLAASGLRQTVVISERIHPGHHPVGRGVPLARRLLYPKTRALVVQSREIAHWFRTTLGIEAAVIANPVECGRFGPRNPEGARKRLVSVGRLHRQKGYDLLIAAFAALAADFPDWDLEIFGEGAERPALEALIARLGLAGRVALPGVVDDIPERLAAASAYVQPSRYEGFPNALVEALAAGCPVVAADAPGATAEILDGGRYGLLSSADDAAALEAALRRLMADSVLRRDLAGRARDAAARFDADAIARQWLDLFESLR